MKKHVDLSIIICTHNNIDILVNYALKSMSDQKTNEDICYEVLVVDNASDDGTEKTVKKFAETNKNIEIKYIYEHILGLSYARNRGVRSSQGAIVAFLDNDSYADERWINVTIDSFKKYPEALAIGGKTIPICSDPTPAWFSGRMLSLVGGHDFGDKVIRLVDGRYLQGANMALRREAFHKYGMFRGELGRKGKMILSHEEGDVFMRMIANRESIYYIPEMFVQHFQSDHRLKASSLIQYQLSSGYSESFVDVKHKGFLFTMLKAAKKIFINIFLLMRLIPDVITREWSELYFALFRIVFSAGYLKGTILQLIKGPFIKTEPDILV